MYKLFFSADILVDANRQTYAINRKLILIKQKYLPAVFHQTKPVSQVRASLKIASSWREYAS